MSFGTDAAAGGTAFAPATGVPGRARMPRKLPLRIPPVPGESFAGYLDRLAKDLRTSLASVIVATGIAKLGRSASATSVPGGYGVFLSPERMGRFCHATDLSPEKVDAMLLTGYDGICEDFSGIQTADPRPLTTVFGRPWVYYSGTHACPLCLAEGRVPGGVLGGPARASEAAADRAGDPVRGVWKLAWKLPWSFACVEHRVLMLDSCPGCGSRLRTGWYANRGKPTYSGRVPEPDLCMGPLPLPDGSGKGSRRGDPCGHRLADSPALSLEPWTRLFEVQEYLDRALAGTLPPDGGLEVAGEPVTTFGYFRDLKALTLLLLAYGSVGDLVADVPPFSLAAFEGAEEARDAGAGPAGHAPRKGGWRARKTGRGPSFAGSFASPSSAGGAGPRTVASPNGFPPEDAALLSAVVPSAVGTLACGSVRGMADIVEAPVRRAVSDRSGASFVRTLLASSSPRFAEVFRLAETGPVSVSDALFKAGRRRGSGRTRYGHVPPGFVPQSFWEGMYAELFAGLLSPMADLHARRVCSMALVRLMCDLSWRGAAEALELPADRGEYLGRNAARNLRGKEGAVEEFASRVGEAARRFAALPAGRRIDYRERRRSLALLEEVPPGVWSGMCAKAGLHPGSAGGRNRDAAAWLWSTFAGSDYRLSPTLQGMHGELAWNRYNRFVDVCAANGRMVALLMEYGSSLLAGDEGEAGRYPEDGLPSGSEWVGRG